MVGVGKGLMVLIIYTVGSSFMCVSLTRIGYNTFEKQVNAICLTRTFMYVCWLLHRFCNQSEDTKLGDGPNFSWFETIFIMPFSIMQGLTRTQLYCVVAELTVLNILSTCKSTDP